MSSINLLKKTADNTVGRINRGIKYLLQNMDPASKNLFQFILYPKAVGSLSDLSTILDVAADTMIAQVSLRAVDLNFMSIEYEAYGELKGPKRIVYPGTITLQILEDDFGFVGNYLYKWVNSIMFPVYESDSTSGVSRTNYIFTDNQEGAKKNALLIPQSGIGLPALRFIKMYGLKYQELEGITYGHGEGDPLIYTLTCSVDSVWFEPLI